MKTPSVASPTATGSVDPVDYARAMWREELGDPSKFLAMGSIMRLHQFVTSSVDATLKQFNLARNSYLVLVTLIVSEDGAELLSHIASELLVHPATVTLLADKLEDRDLIRRTPHPRDRRATLATITDAGRTLVSEATRALDESDFGMPGLTTTEAQVITEVLRPLRIAAGDVWEHLPEH
jgi:DNA-binding MarR family transcriptional regulator